jgi:hypothetical protein
MARQTRRGKHPNKRRTVKSDYFTQPGKRGAVIVLRKPIGNRATAKVCGVMPSRTHAKMLINQLERAESVVKDLFLEATDDGIEALEAVLAACRKEVLEKGPKLPGSEGQRFGGSDEDQSEGACEDEDEEEQ